MIWKEHLSETLRVWKQDIESLDQKWEGLNLSELLNYMQAEENTVIGIFGEFKVGKSTFLNALLGEKLAIEGDRPTTAVATKYTYGMKNKYEVQYKDGTSRSLSKELYSKLSIEIPETRSERDNIEYFNCEIPDERLKNKVIIDTPGFSSINTHHDDVSKKIIDEVDFAIVLVDRNAASTIEMLKLFQKNKVPVHGIYNDRDRSSMQVNDGEEDDGIIINLKNALGKLIISLDCISALDAYEGKVKNDQELYRSSNFEVVEDLIKSLHLTQDQRTNRVLSKLVECFQYFHTTLKKEKTKYPITFYGSIMGELLDGNLPSTFKKHLQLKKKIEVFDRLCLALADVLYEDVRYLDHTYHEELKATLLEFGLIGQLPKYNWNSINRINDIHQQIDNESIKLKSFRENVSRSWQKESKFAFLRKHALEMIFTKQYEFNNKRTEIIELENEAEFLLAEAEKDLEAYAKSLTAAIHSIYADVLDYRDEAEKQWYELWNEQNQQLSKISLPNLKGIKKIQHACDVFINEMPMFFGQEYEEIKFNFEYQKAKYLFEIIQEESFDMPIDVTVK
ncbi:dynamin family protein [Sporosarcina sp. P26b]|uniref:dynamin family protein n=1 Tax=Sporosarcina sp. P26b TaxID=2048253 RepID=UPI00117B586C|nr:dynamin family protein [Sporosarcina sp. P26b]